MKTSDILRTTAGRHIGYMPQSVAVTSLNPKGEGFLRQLRSIPNKITAYFHRDKIKSVHKTIFGGLDDTYYIITATDGTFFHVEY